MASGRSGQVRKALQTVFFISKPSEVAIEYVREMQLTVQHHRSLNFCPHISRRRSNRPHFFFPRHFWCVGQIHAHIPRTLVLPAIYRSKPRTRKTSVCLTLNSLKNLWFPEILLTLLHAHWHAYTPGDTPLRPLTSKITWPTRMEGRNVVARACRRAKRKGNGNARSQQFWQTAFMTSELHFKGIIFYADILK